MKFPILYLLLLLTREFAQAQQDSSRYNAHDFFLESFAPPAGNIYRSATGIPGPRYWQNAASYTIHATLNEKDTSITGEVTISYVNNSPDSLRFLWLQLDQNIFRPDSRGAAAVPASGDPFGILGQHGGFQIGDITVTHQGKSYSAAPVITDTRMQLRLTEGMAPGGGRISLKIKFRFFIPAEGAGRMGRLSLPGGTIYQIAQWYPRMCVYDDVEGWNTLPYMGQGEFYCDYGDCDYYITAPADMVVYGSGDLQNPAQVLSATEIGRLADAAKSIKTIPIITAAEAGKPATRPAGTGNLTWHYTIKNARDVAWAASKGLIWDAAAIRLPSGRKAIAMSAYPPESAGDSAWFRSTEYLKRSIEIYSAEFFEYPWNTAVSIAGNISGMEYPGMIFNNYTEVRGRLWFLIAHEIGHNWFPMIIGSNERKYMWLDEGLNSYINYYATDLFNKGEYVKDSAFLKNDFFASRDYRDFMNYRDPLMTVSEAMNVAQHYQYYGKTAYGLNLLRTVVVGKPRFDYAFRKYTEAWAFKHPTPYDLFHCINNATGEDLNWFWKEWFFTTWKLDQAITKMEYVNGDFTQGARITVVNKEKMIMPLIARIVQEGGQTDTVRLPVEIWQRGATWTFQFASTKKIERIELDPDKALPDLNRSDNVWTAQK